MICQNFMTRNPVVCAASDSVAQAIQTMRDKNVGVLPVVASHANRRLVGIVTDRDVMVRVSAAGRDPHKTTIAEMMTADPVSCKADTSYPAMLDLMTAHSIRRLPVVDSDGEVIGIVTQDDILPYVDWCESGKARRRTGAFAASVGLCLGAGIGAGLMYLFDPIRGKVRRAVLRDKAVSGYHSGKHILERQITVLDNRTAGMAALLRRLFGPQQPVSDERLVARVRTRLGRIVTHPHSVQVSAREGYVTLTGTVKPYAMKRIEASVRRVPGVRDVSNQLTVQTPAGDSPPAAAWRHPAHPEGRVASTIAGLVRGALSVRARGRKTG